MARAKHIDHILGQWPFDPEEVRVRVCQGADKREVLQMRVDLGVLQLEVKHRPDGMRPHGCETYLDYMLAEAAHRGIDFRLDEEQCREIDREFVQFYHRRVCWLKLREFRRAVSDADHTLSLMDFCLEHSHDEQWTASHEQYRPFVLVHRIQAAALAELDEHGAERAIQEINRGLQVLRQVLAELEWEGEFEDQELVQRLLQLRETLREEYGLGRTLQERLADAVAAEEYELAARLRDELASRNNVR